MLKAFLFFGLFINCLSLSSQEKIIDTISCPINDGLYRYYVSSSKDIYLEGKIKNCNKVGTWQLYNNHSVKLLMEYNNGVCYKEMTKSASSDVFLLTAKLSNNYDTLVINDFNNKGLMECQRVYLLEKNSLSKNSTLSSENVDFNKKLICQISINYTPFMNDETFTSTVEKKSEKVTSTKYYKNYFSNNKILIFEIDGNNKFIFGDKNVYYKLRKNEIKYLKKASA